jgi:hypothetical protein
MSHGFVAPKFRRHEGARLVTVATAVTLLPRLRPREVRWCFGGTTEIQKEIIARGLGL